MEVDHIGYAVKNIEKAKEAFTQLGFLFGDTIEDPMRNIYICFGQEGGLFISFIYGTYRTCGNR